MLIACWSPKGGAGTTVVATALALVLADRAPSGALLADLAGDVPAVLGAAEVEGPGLAGWLAAGAQVPVDALGRLERRPVPRLGLLDRGAGPLDPIRADVLAALLAADERPAVVDCGTAPEGAALAVAAAADRNLAVTRPCFLALRRAGAVPLRPTGVVLVAEPGRSLDRRDVEAQLGAPVVATVEVDPAVARAVDAGVLAVRLPRGLARELRHAA
jgi:MinD-like ATPase involved in chromosome partitioning or flagellar assembly